jgi:hypothetical protein
VIVDNDGRLRVLDAATGKPYVRPDEAEERVRALVTAEERIRALEAELQQMRQTQATPKKPTRRRKKP